MTGFAKVLSLIALLAMAGFGGVAHAADKSWPIDEVDGKADAPNTIIEYSSLTCPHCAHFHTETWPQVKEKWIDTGKAKLIMRDFPLDGRAMAAALVAHCSGDRYFAFVDAFFRTQDTWAHAQDSLTAIKTIAKLGGMGDAQVDACWKNSELLNQINARKQEGVDKYNIDSTPSFVVNGKVVPGALPYDEFVKNMK